jgi:hypothetical protein
MKSLVLFLLCWAAIATAADLRLGIIGTDTSHCLHFVRIINEPSSPEHVPGARIVAAFGGGSADIESSHTRVQKHLDELHQSWKVAIAPTIPALLKQVDAVLLLSSDGRVHLAQARLVIAAGKPLFIDKPLAATLEDAREIARLAAAARVPWFSSSGLRFGEIARTLRDPDTRGVITWGPGPLERHHYLELGWYAIHAVELAYTLMGPGCQRVSQISTPDMDEITGLWRDGRIASVRAIRPSSEFGAVVFGVKGPRQSKPGTPFGYRPLVEQIIHFFQTGTPPVAPEETLEILAFLDAAQRSKQQDGEPVALR